MLILTGCTRDSEEFTEIKFWVMGQEGDAVRRMIPEFERLNPHVRVNVQQIPWSAAHEKLLTAYAGGVLPDIFQLGNTWIPEFVTLGALEPLSHFISDSSVIDASEYFDGIININRIQDTFYSVPWYVDTRVLFYRSDLLEQAGLNKPPRTWNEWISAMRILRNKDKQSYAILLPANEWAPLVILAMQNGAGLLKNNNQYADFDTEAFRQAFDFYIDIFKEDLAPPVSNTQISNLYQEFAKGKFVFYISGPWNIEEFKRRLPEALQNNWMTAPMPAPSGNQPGLSLAGGASLAVSAVSRNKKLAWKFIEYLSEPDHQLEFYRLTGDLPANRQAWLDGKLFDDPHAQAFWQQLQHVVATPKIPEWERIAEIISQYAESAVRGKITREQAYTSLNQDVNQLLDKRRWILGKLSFHQSDKSPVQ